MNAPSIIFRADASPAMGGGHVMRCLAIAEASTTSGAAVAFATGADSLDAAPALAAVPRRSPEPSAADVVLIDGYHLGAAEAEAWAQAGVAVAVLDDAPERPRPCALRIDPTPGRTAEQYRTVAPGARLLLGPDFAPMRPIYTRLRPPTLARRARWAPVQVVLVSLGLTDAAGLAPAAAEAALRACPGAAVDVAVGSGAASLSALRSLAADERRLTLHIDAPNVPELTAAADLAVGAAGVSCWERCALGLPTVTVVAAENQQANADALTRTGAAAVASDTEAIRPMLEALAGDGPARQAMSQAAAGLCDGAGARRIADELLALAVARRRSAGLR